MLSNSGFTLTVEYAGGGTWRDAAVFDTDTSAWKCGGYLNAIHSDKNFFDNLYEESKDSYKAAFRGRGLIQLTHCYNYMRFFYHFMSKQRRFDHLEEKKFVYTYKETTGNLESQFCDRKELESIAEGFTRDGLHLPVELTANFENTLDRLSLPCNLTTVSFMQGPEFITDSALWFWKKCREEHPSPITDPSDKAVGVLSDCVHGSRLYRRFDEGWCSNGAPREDMMRQFLDETGNQRGKNDRRRFLTSYCKRLHNFNALMGCF